MNFAKPTRMLTEKEKGGKIQAGLREKFDFI